MGIMIWRFTLLTALFCMCLNALPLAQGRATARQIQSNNDLAKGKTAKGALGDYLLANPHVRFIIDDVRRRSGFAESGGNILDAVNLPENTDALNQVFTYFGNEYPRQARYDRVEIVDNGSGGGAARLRVQGTDMRDPTLKVTTDYILDPGVSYLRLVTTILNSGNKPLEDFAVGDVIQWGRAQRFAPGYGREGAGRTLNVEWVVGLGENVSYGYFAETGTIYGPQGSNWSDFNVTKLNLSPGQSQSYTRYFAVGRGDVSSISNTIFRRRKVSTGTIKGSVLEVETGAKITRASLRVERHGKLFSTVLARADGSYDTLLPPGAYRFRASGFGRIGGKARQVVVAEGQELTQDFTLSRQGNVKFSMTDKNSGRPLPAKLTFHGLGSTPDPDFGPAYQTPAANVVFNHTGSGEIRIAPGFYEVTISRGLEYTLDRVRLEVKPGLTTPLQGRLARVVDTSGYIAGDFHLHAENSPDSNISLRDKVIDLVAEGVEFAVATDHNYLTDYANAIKELQLESELKSSIGNEVTVTSKFHFNAFPLELHPEKPGQGAVAVVGKWPKQLFDEIRREPGEKVIQINHPRAGSIGYFDTFKLDPDTGTSADPNYSDGFDAIEVFNGKRVAEAERVLQDWFSLLNRGHRYTATGNSDSHQIVGEEAGYPRNFVWVGKDDPAAVREEEVVQAVRRHRIVVSNGPFVEFSAGPLHPMGSTVPAQQGSVKFDIRVQSAPWVDVCEVTLIGNGEVVEHFLVTGQETVVKFERSVSVRPARDTWYIVIVRGSNSLAPVIPSEPGQEVTPLAFTNPIWVDADANGRFEPLFR